MRLFSYALYALIPVLLMMGIYGKRGYLDWRRMLQQNEELAAKVLSSQRRKESLERRIQALESNRHSQELAVRQLLGFVKKDEIVIEF